MLNITFNKTKPSQRQYEYSIVGNAQVDVVRFVLQSDICSEHSLSDLEDFSAYVKVQSAGGEYIDKISATSDFDGGKNTLTIDFSLLKKTTQFKNISLQLQFESDEGQVVAQTEIVCLSLKSSIKADEEIPDLYPSELQRLEGEVADHEERIEELEQSGTGGGKVDDVKVNGESVVENKVANIDLTPYATKEELNGKQDVLTFDNEPTEDSSNPVKSGGVYTACENIRQVAEGKCKSFTISISDNADFNSQSASISGITSIKDISGNIIQVSSLKNGDIVLVIETDVPDRWYSTSDSKFYILETAKVDLTNYASLNSNNDFTGNNTHSGTETFSGSVRFTYDETKYSTFYVKDNKVLYLKISETDYFAFSETQLGAKGNIVPFITNTSTVGKANLRYANAYLVDIDFSGVINSNANGFGLVAPNTSGFTANKEIATIDQVNVKANESVISDQYDTTKTYAVGDLVIYNNTLYKCSTAITQAEAWDSSHWTATKVSELVANETIVKLDTGTYTSGTQMSANDLAVFQPLLNMNVEEATKYLKNKMFLRLDSSRNETQSSVYVSVRAGGQGFNRDWYDIQISFGSYGNFTLMPARLQNGTY